MDGGRPRADAHACYLLVVGSLSISEDLSAHELREDYLQAAKVLGSKLAMAAKPSRNVERRAGDPHLLESKIS